MVGTRGKGPWTRSNNIDFVFFSPTLKPLTYEGLKEVGLEPTAESQDSVRWVYTVIGGCNRQKSAPVATEAMRKILEKYPPKDKELLRIPWHYNADSAFYFASFEDRRLIAVPARKGAVSLKALEALGDPELLRKHIHNYAFLKVDPDQAPAEIRAAFEQAGPDGWVILERPDEAPSRQAPWSSARVLATGPGEGALQLLDKHGRAPGWDAKAAGAK